MSQVTPVNKKRQVKEADTQERRLHQNLLRQTALHQTAFTPNAFFTRNLVHQTVFTPNTFYTRHLLHQTTFTPNSCYTKQLLPRNGCGNRGVNVVCRMHHNPYDTYPPILNPAILRSKSAPTSSNNPQRLKSRCKPCQQFSLKARRKAELK